MSNALTASSNGARALNRPAGSVEDDHKAVADRLDFPPSKPLELAPHNPVVGVQERFPGPIPKLGGPVCRCDNVSEQHRGQDPVGYGRVTCAGKELLDLGEIGVAVANEDQVLIAPQLDQRGARNIVG
jgi:hypothetical protein